MRFKLIAELDSFRVELLNEELREMAAQQLAAVAAAGAEALHTAKRRGRPPGSKNSVPPSAPQPEQGVDLAALANGEE
jgi:hypothetical protein